MTTHYEMRRNIAKYCANILHGNHNRKQASSYQIYHTLAGVSFLEVSDRIDLARLVIERLGLLIENHYTVYSIVITRLNEDQILITGKIKRR